MPISTSTASFFVELLRSREWRQYSNLFPLGTTQVLIPAFPRNQTIWTTFRPPSDIYCHVVYGAVFGINMLPDVFTFTYQAWGSRIYSGTCTSSILGVELAFLLPVTQQQPVLVAATNITALLQYFEINWRYLVVRTEVEYKQMVEFLERLAVSKKMEDDIAEVRAILARIEGG